MTDEHDVLAKEIADKLREIAGKEARIEEIKKTVIELETHIKTLSEEKRSLDNEINSVKYLISERISKPKADIVPIKK